MKKNKPFISIIIPTFNEGKRIRECLNSIINQEYPRSRIEIIVVDDGSVDDTLKVAKEYKAKIVRNGTNNIERGKSIGLEHASSEFVFFLDADNALTNNNWLAQSVSILDNNKHVVGVQSYKYLYNPSDKAVNRYCQLFGINDPMAMYLGKRGQLMIYENKWIYPNTLIKETKVYDVVRFTVETLPTIGSQGYMTRKSLLKKTSWKPYLFHMDSAYELVATGHNTFVMLKYEIKHDYVNNLGNLIKKYRRNIQLYYKYQHLRKYKYNLSKIRLATTIVVMATLIIPIKDSIAGYLHKRDAAWFLHPVICLVVLYIYATETLKFYWSEA